MGGAREGHPQASGRSSRRGVWVSQSPWRVCQWAPFLKTGRPAQGESSCSSEVWGFLPTGEQSPFLPPVLASAWGSGQLLSHPAGGLRWAWAWAGSGLSRRLIPAVPLGRRCRRKWKDYLKRLGEPGKQMKHGKSLLWGGGLPKTPVA